MARWILFHNPKCSKSREALQLLKSRQIEPEIVEYLKNPPTEADLRLLISKLQDPIETLVRVKEEDYQTQKFDIRSFEEVLQQLSKNSRLLERPIVVRDEVAVVARPLERINFLFELEKK